MTISELRGMSDNELASELEEVRRSAMNLRFRAATMQLSNFSEIKKAKKQVAQILTIIQERKLTRTPK